MPSPAPGPHACSYYWHSLSLPAGVGAEEIFKPDADAILEALTPGCRDRLGRHYVSSRPPPTSIARPARRRVTRRSLVLLGMAYDAGRRHPEAIKANREAQQALAALGDPFGGAFLEVHMRDFATRVGDFVEAEDHYARALTLLRALKASGESLTGQGHRQRSSIREPGHRNTSGFVG